MQNLASSSSNLVPKVLGVTSWHDGKKVALMMEKYSGITVNDLISYNWAPFNTNAQLYLRIVHQISSALFELHKAGILHNDVTPRNVLLDDDVTIKLIDFGCSTLENENSSKSSGTPGFAAPEDGLSCFSDVYSFGVVLKYILYNHNGVESTQSDSQSEIDSLLNSFTNITNSAAKTIFKKLANIANETTEREADDRPSIEKVFNNLSKMMVSVDVEELNLQTERLKNCDAFQQRKIEEEADGWTGMSDDREF